jgi:hypothetical protein
MLTDSMHSSTDVCAGTGSQLGGDGVRPTKDQKEDVVNQSRRIWQSYYMKSLAQETLPSRCFQLQNMLRKAPSLPDGSDNGNPMNRLRKAAYDGVLCCWGYGNWVVSGKESCGLGKKIRQSPLNAMTMGVTNPTSVFLTGTAWQSWSGHAKASGEGNLIAVLTLGLAYVFSQRLVELQGQEDEGAKLKAGHTYYTDKSAPVINVGGSTDALYTDIFIGSVDSITTRWWRAILAPGQGWRTVVSESADCQFTSPWGVHVKDSLRFRIRQETTVLHNLLPTTIPSSEQAMKMLSSFCELHNATDQFAAAVVAALFLPVHNYYRIEAHLPRPAPRETYILTASPSTETTCFEDFQRRLPNYLTLGCNPRGLVSNLCGLFWEPGVTCNVASAWLHPPLKELPLAPGIEGCGRSYNETLVKISAIRRPEIAPLWLGASLCGTLPIILSNVKTGLPIMDPDASAWAGSFQSFIEYPTTRSRQHSTQIHRADIWRLMYITNENFGCANPPLSPWQPFGELHVDEVPIAVRQHFDCGDHNLRYDSWSWVLAKGSHLRDAGYTSERIVTSLVSDLPDVGNCMTGITWPISVPSDEASENATRHAFQWVTANGQGHLPCEKSIYAHPWVQLLDSDHETASDSDLETQSESDVDNVSLLQTTAQTEQWIMRL